MSQMRPTTDKKYNNIWGTYLVVSEECHVLSCSCLIRVGHEYMRPGDVSVFLTSYLCLLGFPFF